MSLSVFISDSPEPTQKAFQKSSIRQRNHLAESYQGLVRKEAHRFARVCSEPVADLIQEGNLGLLKAIDGYEPAKGAFVSYAQRCIRGAIQHYLRDKGWGAVKPPRRWVEAVSKVQKCHREALQQGRQISEVEAAAELGIVETAWSEMLSSKRRSVALPEGFDVAAPETDEELAAVAAAVDRLTDPYKTCVVERYFHNASKRELAKRMQTKPAQIDVWIQEGLNQLREDLQSELG